MASEAPKMEVTVDGKQYPVVDGKISVDGKDKFVSMDGKVYDTAKKRDKRDWNLTCNFEFIKGAAGDINALTEKRVAKPGQIKDGWPVNIEGCENIEICILDICEQVQINEVKNCKIFVGPCTSAVLVNQCEDCILTVATKQLRINESKNLHCNVWVENPPALDQCTGLTFAPFNGAYPTLPEKCEAAKLSTEFNNWKEAHDFTTNPSPDAFKYLPAESYPAEWVVEIEGMGPATNPISKDAPSRHFDEDGMEVHNIADMQKGVAAVQVTEAEATTAPVPPPANTEAASALPPAPPAGGPAPPAPPPN